MINMNKFGVFKLDIEYKVFVQNTQITDSIYRLFLNNRYQNYHWYLKSYMSIVTYEQL